MQFQNDLSLLIWWFDFLLADLLSNLVCNAWFVSYIRNLVQAQEQTLGKEGSLSVSPDESSLDDAGAVDAVLVNTHQVLS